VTTQPPAPRPCTYCPYRRDVPSGVWSAEEYAKLARYDRPTWEQPPAVFRCHVHDRDSERGTVCAGWAGCHDCDELMALRVGTLTGEIPVETAEAIRAYRSPVPLFDSGAEAAAHGMREILNPGPEARKAIRKIGRIRTDLNEERSA
jgi:sarcosine oxidase delta subunit